MKKFFPKYAIRFLLISANLVVVWLVLSWILMVVSPGMIFLTERSINVYPQGIYEQGFFGLDNGKKIDFVYADNLQSSSVVVYIHGNSGRIPHFFPELSQKYDVFAPAHPGFHNSEGLPATDVIFETGQKAYEYLVNKGYKEESIIIWGHSLGAPSAMHLARIKPNARALVVVNGVSSVERMCWRRYSIFCTFSGSIMNGIEEAKLINPETPSYHYHLKTDTTVPFEEGQALFDANSSQKKTFTELDTGTHTLIDISKTLVGLLAPTFVHFPDYAELFVQSKRGLHKHKI